jgi:tetratricopeptide (TPR) repeat protein
LAVILLAYYKGLLNLKTEKDLLSVFLMGCLTSWLICVSFNPVPVPMYLFLAVLIAGLFLKHQKSFPFKPSVKVKSILLLAGSLVSIFAILVLSSDVLFAKAFRLYSEKDYDGAYKFSNMAATLNPTNEWILTVRADSVVHLNLGKDKVEDAINRIKKARKNEADSWVISGDIYYLLYQTKGDKQNLALAISNIQEALKVDPYFAERYGQLALYQYQNGQFGEAKLSLFKELGLFDKDFSAWILLAKIYQNEGNKSATIASLNKAFKIHPESNQLKYIIYLAKYFPDIKRVSIPVVSPQQ